MNTGKSTEMLSVVFLGFSKGDAGENAIGGNLRPGTDPRCADLILILFFGLDLISIANSNVGIT